LQRGLDSGALPFLSWRATFESYVSSSMAFAAASIPLFTSPWFEVARGPGRVVLVRRTAAHFDSAEDVERGHAELVQVLDGLPREQLALLVDLRQAPARNDPEFERLMQAYRPRIFAR